MFPNYSLRFILGISSVFTALTVADESILGGHIAVPDQFSYQVLIKFHSQDSICGGGIIGDEYILTAAHCVYKSDGHIDQGRIGVFAGMHDWQAKNPPLINVKVKTIYVSKNFTPKSTIPTDDIAVLKLVRPLGLGHNPHLSYLQLPENKNVNFVGEKAMFAGYGFHWFTIYKDEKQGGHYDTLLRFSRVIILRPGELGYPKEKVPSKLIWARIRQKEGQERGVCVGDSGGPLVHDHRTVIGILSTGPIDCSEKEYASAYTDVSQYLDFIHHVIHGIDDEDIISVDAQH